MISEEQWEIEDYCECGAIIFIMDDEHKCPDCSCNEDNEKLTGYMGE
ncbi:unnamed protein product [marine sediment metagenome]|uniref:Uncharacterized protein n=1 Tax=marine sediment metagenome TaxID=412755 RepID=X0WRB1_9ZZZZ